MGSRISEKNVRALVRLVADVASMNTSHAAAKQHLMDGLVKMAAADCRVWALSYPHPEKPPVYVSLQHGGFSEARSARYVRAVEHPDMMALRPPSRRFKVHSQAELMRRFARAGAAPEDETSTQSHDPGRVDQ